MVLLESSRGNRVQGVYEIVLINDLNQQGLSVLALAQQVGYDRKMVKKKYIERSLEARYVGLRAARSAVLNPYSTYLTERVAASTDLLVAGFCVRSGSWGMRAVI